MWEIYSLGETPYFDIDVPSILREKLLHGYRMGKPDNADDIIYDLMLKCWSLEPENRPAFAEIVSEIAEIVEIVCIINEIDETMN